MFTTKTTVHIIDLEQITEPQGPIIKSDKNLVP